MPREENVLIDPKFDEALIGPLIFVLAVRSLSDSPVKRMARLRCLVVGGAAGRQRERRNHAIFDSI